MLRYDAANLEEFQRFTAGGYWGEPDAAWRVIVHYEYFKDEAGTHDGRVTAQAQAVF